MSRSSERFMNSNFAETRDNKLKEVLDRRSHTINQPDSFQGDLPKWLHEFGELTPGEAGAVARTYLQIAEAGGSEQWKQNQAARQGFTAEDLSAAEILVPRVIQELRASKNADPVFIFQRIKEILGSKTFLKASGFFLTLALIMSSLGESNKIFAQDKTGTKTEQTTPNHDAASATDNAQSDALASVATTVNLSKSPTNVEPETKISGAVTSTVEIGTQALIEQETLSSNTYELPQTAYLYSVGANETITFKQYITKDTKITVEDATFNNGYLEIKAEEYPGSIIRIYVGKTGLETLSLKKEVPTGTVSGSGINIRPTTSTSLDSISTLNGTLSAYGELQTVGNYTWAKVKFDDGSGQEQEGYVAIGAGLASYTAETSKNTGGNIDSEYILKQAAKASRYSLSDLELITTLDGRPLAIVKKNDKQPVATIDYLAGTTALESITIFNHNKDVISLDQATKKYAENTETLAILESVPDSMTKVVETEAGPELTIEKVLNPRMQEVSGRIIVLNEIGEEVFEYTRFGWAQRQFSSQYVDINLDLDAMNDEAGVRAKEYGLVGGMTLVAGIRPYTAGDASKFYPIDASLDKWASGGIEGGKVKKHPLIEDELSSTQILDALYFQIITMITYDTESPTEVQLLSIKKRIENGEKIIIRTTPGDTKGDWDVTQGMEIHVGAYPEGEQKWFGETATSQTISTLATPSWFIDKGRLILSLVNLRSGGIFWLEKEMEISCNSFLTDLAVSHSVSTVEQGIVNFVGPWEVLFGSENGSLRGVAASYTVPLGGEDLKKSP